MSSQVTEARLRRLAAGLKPADSNAEAEARDALREKLDGMAERLRDARGSISSGEVHSDSDARYDQNELDGLSQRLERLITDPSATDSEIERVLAAMRIARFKQRVSLEAASRAGLWIMPAGE